MTDAYPLNVPEGASINELIARNSQPDPIVAPDMGGEPLVDESTVARVPVAAAPQFGKTVVAETVQPRLRGVDEEPAGTKYRTALQDVQQTRAARESSHGGRVSLLAFLVALGLAAGYIAKSSSGNTPASSRNIPVATAPHSHKPALRQHKAQPATKATVQTAVNHAGTREEGEKPVRPLTSAQIHHINRLARAAAAATARRSSHEGSTTEVKGVPAPAPKSGGAPVQAESATKKTSSKVTTSKVSPDPDPIKRTAHRTSKAKAPAPQASPAAAGADPVSGKCPNVDPTNGAPIFADGVAGDKYELIGSNTVVDLQGKTCFDGVTPVYQ